MQGTAIFVTGLALGIPLGVALGRTGWGLVADSVPLDQVAPFAMATVMLLVPVALLAAQVVAYAPGRRVARMHAAEVLRTE
ncbi:MAG: hypothetical protein Q8K58_01480 [Acidimicrobiales bacterium]|nr:hypothetical protein [Acidimicrobiales bacterium]